MVTNTYLVLQKYDFFECLSQILSSYTALSNTIGGHFLTNILLRTCIVIKVTLPKFCISYMGEDSFYLQPFGYFLFYIYLYR